MRFFPHRAVYDWECRFKNLPGGDGKLKYLKTLIPASFSMKSNVTGRETVECKLDENPAELVKQFVDEMRETAEISHKLMTTKYAGVFQQLQERIGNIKELQKEVKSAQAQMESICTELEEQIRERRAQGLQDDQVEQILQRQIAEAKNNEELEALWGRYKKASLYCRLQNELAGWTKRLPIVGFNSGRFDLNLIRDHFMPYFLKTQTPGSVKSLKRGQTFMSISSPEMQFLDISLYLGPGISYEKFIKAYGVKATKGYWPYEWFETFDQLDQAILPPRSAFYSVLKQKSMTEEEYAELQHIWEEHQFRTMRELLVWYNNLDVAPLLEAVSRMADNFQNMLGLDIFKQAISLPGLALAHLFDEQKPQNFMQLFSKKTRAWEDIVRQNIVGGPSVIFHRRHIADETKLRTQDGKTVRSVLGYDANALYLWCTGQKMPVGLGIAYEPKTQNGHTVPTTEGVESPQTVQKMISENMRVKFSRRLTDRCKLELDYITWKLERLKQEHGRQDLTVMHSHNGGQMKFFKGKKPIFVDGYVPQLNLIMQFHGCRWHGCVCQQGKMDEPQRLERRQNTQLISDFLRETGKQLIEEWECDFKKRPGAIEHIAKAQLKGRSGMTASQILKMVQNEDIFGLIEIDVQVPWWVSGLRDKMDEMAPIFKNVEVTRDNLDETMRKFAIDNSLMSRPRRTLINSFFGEKILVATPLAKWYMDQGLVVTRVHRCLQFRGERIFQHLADEVTAHRSEADRDPDKKVLADMYKLLGNSYYARNIWNFDSRDWQKVATSIMEEVLFAKFAQNTVARKRLLDTGDARLVAATEFDSYWGTGLNILDDDNFDEAKWKGANVLGIILMDVREKLRKCLTNKLKQNKTAYMTEEHAHRAINEQLFQALDEVSDDTYEVSTKNSKIKFDLPVLVAYFVYSYAKQKMLSFYYQFLDRILKREDFEMCEMDTDSLYFACSAKTLEDAIAPERRLIFEQLKKEFLALDPDPHSTTYDMRTPGLFKLEWSGRAIISLASKTYVCFDDEETALKLSIKGVSKQTNSHITPKEFKTVLDKKVMVDGINYGFRRLGRQLAFYQQERTGLTYFYAKRHVMANDRTRTLSICKFHNLTSLLATSMLRKFLSDCRYVSIRRDHIYDHHFTNVGPTSSYFTIGPEKLFAIINAVISLRMLPSAYRVEGPEKLVVWVDCTDIVGHYRKLEVATSQFAIIITKRGQSAIVRTAYPDGIGISGRKLR